MSRDDAGAEEDKTESAENVKRTDCGGEKKGGWYNQRPAAEKCGRSTLFGKIHRSQPGGRASEQRIQAVKNGKGD